jgi:hypothetical protein
MAAQASEVTVSENIARAVMLPVFYGDLVGTPYPAWRWLREDVPPRRRR